MLALLTALLLWLVDTQRQEAALGTQARQVQEAAQRRWQAGEAFTEVGSAEDCTGNYAGKVLRDVRACEVIRLPRGFEVSLRAGRVGRTVTFFGAP